MKNIYRFFFVAVCIFYYTDTVAQTNFWEKIDSPINGDSVYGFAINESGTIFVGTSNGVIISSDQGVNWVESNIGKDVQIHIFAFKSTGTIFCAGIGGFFRTSDGIMWTKIMNNYIASLIINDSGHIFAGLLGDILCSTDDGVSWISKGPVLSAYSLAINSQGNIFAGGWKSSSGSGVIFLSPDNGASWINTNFSASLPVSRVAFTPSGYIFVTLSPWYGSPYNGDGVYYSPDGGTNWISSNFGMITISSITGLAINPSGHVFIGTYGGGVFRSTDDGLNWTTVNTGLTNDTVISIAIDPSGTIFALTTDGLYRSVQSTTYLEDLPGELNFSLDQNFPNPFNPTTTIKYQIPGDGIVSLKVYDVLGKEIASLVNEEKHAGNYEIKFNAEGLSSGVYFYTLKINKFSETKKLLLMK